jgi:hypothetical protein
LRKGGASTAVALGVPLHFVMIFGQWKTLVLQFLGVVEELWKRTWPFHGTHTPPASARTSGEYLYQFSAISVSSDSRNVHIHLNLGVLLLELIFSNILILIFVYVWEVVKDEEDEEEEGVACCICLKRGVELRLLYPCGHRCVCAGCGDKLVSLGHFCPVCRHEEVEMVRVYE